MIIIKHTDENNKDKDELNLLAKFFVAIPCAIASFLAVLFFIWLTSLINEDIIERYENLVFGYMIGGVGLFGVLFKYLSKYAKKIF